MTGRTPTPVGANVIFIDGTCVLCSRIATYILAHDPSGLFHFAHLQGPLAHDLLSRHGFDAGRVDVVYVVLAAGTSEERVLSGGAAAREIGPMLFPLAKILRWIPLPIIDACYRRIARRRYRWFGKYETCRVPTPEERGRFLDVGPRGEAG